MMNKLFLILATLSLLSVTSLTSGDMPHSAANDWAEAARFAQESKAPIIILYTAQACAYCERLKEEVLQPLLGSDHENRMAVFREVDINTGGKMTDFDGEPIRSRQFKQRYHVFATPTLLILGSDGTTLHDPIVGYKSKEQYKTMLHAVLEGPRI